MDNFRVAYTRFLAFYSDNPSGLRDGKTLAKWPSKASFVTHPSTKTEWPPKLLTGFSSWRIELHSDMQERGSYRDWLLNYLSRYNGKDAVMAQFVLLCLSRDFPRNCRKFHKYCRYRTSFDTGMEGSLGRGLSVVLIWCGPCVVFTNLLRRLLSNPFVQYYQPVWFASPLTWDNR